MIIKQGNKTIKCHLKVTPGLESMGYLELEEEKCGSEEGMLRRLH